MKKKILILSIVIILLTTVAVGGSLAWFTDADEVKNTFTVGSVKIRQDEVFDETTAQLLPVVGNDPAKPDDNYIRKEVTVSNVGKNDAYVQTFVAVPKVLVDNTVLGMVDDPAASGCTASKLTATAEIDGMTYTVYRYRYTQRLQPEQTTKPSLQYVYIKSAVDMNGYDDDNNGKMDRAHLVAANGTEITQFDIFDGMIDLYVASQAVQADGFANAEEALDAAFGAGNHPWTSVNP